MRGETIGVLNMTTSSKQQKSPPRREALAECAGSVLLDESAAAVYLHVKPGTLSVWRSTRRYALPFVKIGSCVRYRKRDLDAFIQVRTVGAEAA